MDQTMQRQRIRECVARLFDAEACADELTAYIEQNTPALLYFILRKASGRLQTGPMASDKFLNSLPEPIFAYLLTISIDFLRQGARGVEEPMSLAPELGAVAFVLFLEERGLDTYVGSRDEFYALMDCLARLVLIEDQWRAGVSVWLDRYPALSRAASSVPPRFPAPEWMTPH
jgi:hypothetical protein